MKKAIIIGICAITMFLTGCTTIPRYKSEKINEIKNGKSYLTVSSNLRIEKVDGHFIEWSTSQKIWGVVGFPILLPLTLIGVPFQGLDVFNGESISNKESVKLDNGVHKILFYNTINYKTEEITFDFEGGKNYAANYRDGKVEFLSPLQYELVKIVESVNEAR